MNKLLRARVPIQHRLVAIFSIIICVFFAVTTQSVLAGSPRVINIKDTIMLPGNVHPLAQAAFDVGAMDATMPMAHMILALRRSPTQQSALEQFLVAQLNPTSPNYHRWLTPEEFGQRFGPTLEDIGVVTEWLTSQGLVVEAVAKGRTWINFSGTVANVERALHTQMHDYSVNGRRYHANSQDPSIPKGLADLVTGVVSLHNFPYTALHTPIKPVTPADIQPRYTHTDGNHYLAPGDFATIYNVTPLYNTGIDGSGQTIAIVGRTHPSSSNWANFRSTFGLPNNPPIVIVNGPDPGDKDANEAGEADLDVEWSGAVAKGATIKFVVSASTNTTDGVLLSIQYIIDNNLAAVMSTSFGACEAYLGHSDIAFDNSMGTQAAAQGITFFTPAGDSGAADCDSPNSPSGTSQAIDSPASNPYNVAVGGTQFSEGFDSYWNPVNASDSSSAQGYIPEVAWNESGSVVNGDGLWSTGGGASTIYSKPSWQVGLGVPNDGKRDIPDVSLAAAGHDGYLMITRGAMHVVGGTSASAPAFAGLMALIVQKTGQRQGHANPRFYQLANAQYSSNGPVIFHDITSGNNSVPGVDGYSCTPGYDLVTGLGSVDANALINSWQPASSHVTTTGVSRPINGAIYLKNTNTTGYADAKFTYGLPGDQPIVGDWNGDGITKIGVYRNGVFYLRNSNTNGYADMVFAFGQAGDLPVAGDWNGDGVDTVGVYRNGLFLLRDANSAGDPTYTFGLGVSGDLPIAGDWTHKGSDSVGVFRPSNGALYLKNLNTTGFADIKLTYGLPGDKPVVGDWDGNGTDTIGVYRNGVFMLRNSNTNGDAEITFGLGVDGDVPISGQWGKLP